MSDVTRILSKLEQGDRKAPDELLPIVYVELRKLAAAKMAQEKPGQTLQATALVHEAYVRLVDAKQQHGFGSRGHFFSAAAEAMRRILIENARRKKTVKHGGEHQRVDMGEINPAILPPAEGLIALNDAIDELAIQQPETAKLVELRFFAGFTNVEAAKILNVSPRHADSLWAFAKAWLHERLFGENASNQLN